MIRRVAAIVRADVLVRFRRFSTLVIFLLLSASALLWVPDPRTGRTLIQISGRRALYNSASIGMATAMLATIFVGMFGFYVVSNALRRDAMTRCGYVIASTEMRTHEYLLGKFLGNVVFLATFMTGYMLAAMAMLVIRAEAPLQPFVFASQYLILIPSTIVFVSVLAIVFESIPWLSGRFGDVVYFFAWATTLGVVVNVMENGGSRNMLYLDFNTSAISSTSREPCGTRRVCRSARQHLTSRSRRSSSAVCGSIASGSRCASSPRSRRCRSSDWRCSSSTASIRRVCAPPARTENEAGSRCSIG